MSVSSRYYHFSFNPQKLIKERIQVEKKFEAIENSIITERGKKKLPVLLELIRKTKLSDLENILSSFSKLEIRIIMYEYPFTNEKHEDQLKINYILTALYRSEFGKIIWKLFQEDFTNEYLQSLLKSSHSKEPEKFCGMSESVSISFGDAILNFKGILEGLINFTLKSSEQMSVVFDKWKVVKESSLERKLIEGVLLKGVSTDRIINQEGIETIIEYFNKMPLKTYQEILNNYILVREYKEFDNVILSHAVMKLKNPNEDNKLWEFLNDKSLRKVEKWLLQVKLKEAFDKDIDNKRFEYWKRYIDFLKDVEIIRTPLVAFIYFKDFVVVEFGEIGAAYFYHKKGFEATLLREIKLSDFKHAGNSKKERMLKKTEKEYQGMNLFIDKHDHRGNWQFKFQKHMQNYLNGRFM